MNIINEDIWKHRARDKAFAKLAMLRMEIDKLKDDIKDNNTGGLTIEELEGLLEGTRKEYQTWNFIAKIIETNE